MVAFCSNNGLTLSRQQTSSWDNFCEWVTLPITHLCRLVRRSDDSTLGKYLFRRSIRRLHLWTSMASVNPSRFSVYTTTSSPVQLFPLPTQLDSTSIPSGKHQATSGHNGGPFQLVSSLPSSSTLSWVVSGNCPIVWVCVLGSALHIAHLSMAIRIPVYPFGQGISPMLSCLWYQL